MGRTNVDRDTIGSIVNWLKGMAIAFVLAVLSLLLVGFLTVRGFNEQRDRDNVQDIRQLNARIVESCHNYNRGQTNDRAAAHRKILALAELAGRPIDENNLTPEFAIRLSKYDIEMAEFYTYRKCDLDCAKAALNKDVPDCAISDNEEGT